MKITQQATLEGDDIVLRLHEQPSGKLLGERVWKDAAKYLLPMHAEGYLTVKVPYRAGLNIKPG